jgi:ribose transport system permease protein
VSTDRSVVDVVRDGSWQKNLSFSLSSWVTIGLLVAAIIANASVQRTFFTPFSIMSNFATFTPLVLVAIAQAIVIIGGGLDLSLGANMALSSVVALQVMNGQESRIWMGVLAAVATGAVCGALNGVIISGVRLQPLIVTFATSSIFYGLALVVLPSPGGTVPSVITRGFRDSIGPIPISALLVLGAALLYVALTRTTLMRHIRAVGGDKDAAYASLVPVARVQALTYVVAGAFVGLAALAVLANTGSGDPFVGGTAALDAIAAVVLGGIALSGGRGSAIGAVAGVFILGIVNNVIAFLGTPTTWRQLISGLFIIAALALSVLTTGKGKAR